MTRWHAGREVVAGTFDRHDFSFKWSYAEIARVWRKTHKLLIIQGVSRISSGEDRPDVVFFGVVSQESAHFGSIFATLTS